MTDVIMPQMGESIAEGTITKWLKKVGDKVERDEPLFEISTDKVDAEIPAPAAGVLKEIRVEPGTTVPINTVVGVIARRGRGRGGARAGAAAAAPPAPAARRGAAPRPRPPAPAPPPAPPAAAPRRGAAAAPPRLRLRSAGRQRRAARGARPGARRRLPRRAPRRPPPPAPEKPRAEMTRGRAAPDPLVARRAQDRGRARRGHPRDPGHRHLGPRDQAGHPGPPRDARPAAATRRRPPAAPRAPRAARRDRAPRRRAGAGAAPPPAAPRPIARRARRDRADVAHPPEDRRAHGAVEAHLGARHDGLRDRHDAAWTSCARSTAQAYEERSGVKLTYLPFILKATVDALKAFPILNASVEGDNIVYKKDINLGIAVALDWGLIVPGDPQRRREEPARAWPGPSTTWPSARAAKKLKVDEVQGGTFTITNPGVFGSLFGTPIINQPQVGDPRRRHDREAAGGARRRHRHPHHGLLRPDLRPPHRGRRRRRPLHGPHQEGPAGVRRSRRLLSRSVRRRPSRRWTSAGSGASPTPRASSCRRGWSRERQAGRDPRHAAAARARSRLHPRPQRARRERALPRGRAARARLRGLRDRPRRRRHLPRPRAGRRLSRSWTSRPTAATSTATCATSRR